MEHILLGLAVIWWVASRIIQDNKQAEEMAETVAAYLAEKGARP